MEEACHVPVIFMTALHETSHVLRGFAAGAIDYVTKPIQIDEVLARVATHLASARHLRRVRNALENSGKALLIANMTGELVWSSPRAKALLDRLLPQSLNALAQASQALGDWLRFAIEADAGAWRPLHHRQDGPHRLSARIAGCFDNDEFLIEMEEQSLGLALPVLSAQFKLTAREAEVLLWVSKGKTSRDIGGILSISPRTADKHLENLYVKLGVETRTAAVAIAMRSLQEAQLPTPTKYSS